MDSKLELAYREFVKKASCEVVNQFEDNHKRQQARLQELLSKQRQLLLTMDEELAKFDSSESVNMEDMMRIVRACQSRLYTIKGRMRKASITSSKLKTRSVKLQQTKQKEALDRELRREAQLKREQEMVAKSPLFHDSVHFTKPTGLPN